LENAAIKAAGLTKWFGQVIAVNDLGFESDAPVIGLLGPNGAGKSTLMKLIVGQIRPSKGDVRVFGQTTFNNQSFLSDLGFAPEHDRFYEDLSLIEFVTILTRLHGYVQSEARKLAGLALEKVGLTEKIGQPIKTLSHGMRQRVKIAQAIAHNPKFLVLDEPLNGLDPIIKAKMIALFSELAGEGVHLLISSHVLHELEAITSDILLLNKGHMVARGEVRKIRELIDAHPHRIALTCEQPRELGCELLKLEHVIRVEIDEKKVVIETRSPDDSYQQIGQLAASDGFRITSLMSVDDNLESVFRFLVK
jgi:ABC-2 type transport system ATP-binding protein